MNDFRYLRIDKIYRRMTLQQLRYIIAIDRELSFARAAESLGITQPTLSAMLKKLEDELGAAVFERDNRSVRPTALGKKVIKQARKAIVEIERIAELVAEEKGGITGGFSLSVGPTIAPYILPRFIRLYSHHYPDVELSIRELKTADMAEALRSGRIDAGIAISGASEPGILEIPLYTEQFYVYLSADCLHRLPVFDPASLEHENMWIMKEAQCFRDSAFSFCKARAKGRRLYEAGSIETLIRIVDENGGFTIIPQMHLAMLSDAQRSNVRPIEGEYLSERRVSMYIGEGCVRERMLNTVADTLVRFMPAEMLDSRILRFGIIL